MFKRLLTDSASKHEAILPMGKEWLSVVVDQPLSEPKALVLLCHGLTGDRAGPQRILVHWARELAEAGYLVARFDFRGSGDSSGLFSETTFSRMQEDLEEVIAWSRKQFSFPCLVLGGLSLGAIPAIMTSPSHHDCKGLLLLSSDVIDSPIFSFPFYPASIRNGQFFLHQLFYEERGSIRPRSVLKENLFPSFLFYGTKDEKVCRAAQELQQMNVVSLPIHESDHLFESLEARNLVAKQMVQSLNQITTTIGPI